MSKKKAIVCTVLFAFTLMTLWIASFFVKGIDGSYILSHTIAYILSGVCMGNLIDKFYNWLTKDN